MTSCLASMTSCLAFMTSCLASMTSCLAFMTSCLASMTSCFASTTSCGRGTTSCFASLTSCFASTSSGPRWTSRRRRSAVFFAALRAAVAHLLPSLSFPAKTNQQGHKAKEATSNEEAAAPACIWPSNGCCSPEIGAGKPSNRIFRGASRRISLPVL